MCHPSRGCLRGGAGISQRHDHPRPRHGMCRGRRWSSSTESQSILRLDGIREDHRVQLLALHITPHQSHAVPGVPGAWLGLSKHSLSSGWVPRAVPRGSSRGSIPGAQGRAGWGCTAQRRCLTRQRALPGPGRAGMGGCGIAQRGCSSRSSPAGSAPKTSQDIRAPCASCQPGAGHCGQVNPRHKTAGSGQSGCGVEGAGRGAAVIRE